MGPHGMNFFLHIHTHTHCVCVDRKFKLDIQNKIFTYIHVH